MRRIAVVAVIIVGLSLIPIPYLACPAWDVWVVDDRGQPVRGVTVRLTYQN
jgi:hypothetical protein